MGLHEAGVADAVGGGGKGGGDADAAVGFLEEEGEDEGGVGGCGGCDGDDGGVEGEGFGEGVGGDVVGGAGVED